MPYISCLWQNWNIFILNHHRPEKMEDLRQYSLKWWLISNPLILIFFYSPLLPPPSPSESQNFMLPLIVLLWFCKVSYSFLFILFPLKPQEHHNQRKRWAGSVARRPLIFIHLVASKVNSTTTEQYDSRIYLHTAKALDLHGSVSPRTAARTCSFWFPNQ